MKMVASKLHSIWLRIKSSPKVRQLLAAGGVSHGAIAIGTVIGWYPHALETLAADQDVGPIPPAKLGFLQLFVVIGALAALLPAAFSCARWGRLWTLRFFCLTLLGGWLLVATANGVDMLLAGRFLLGFSCGGFSVVAPIYMVEVAETGLRGLLGFMYTQQIYVGVFMALFTARHDPWRTLTLHMCSIPIITFIFTIFIPDSPVWHLKRGNLEGAQEAVRWLRAVPKAEPTGAILTTAPKVQEEVTQLQDLLGSAGSAQSRLGLWSMFSTAPYKRQVCTTLALLSIQPLLTVAAVQFYSLWIVVISGRGESAPMKPTSVALAVTGAALLGLGIVGHISDRVSRRKLVTASCSLLVVTFGVLGALYYADPTMERLYWPQFAGWCVLFVVYAIGFLAIPHIYLVEVSHPRNVEALMCIASASQWITALVLCFGLPMQIFNPSWGAGPTLWVSAAFCLVAALVAYRGLPETSGRTLTEVQGLEERPPSQQNMVDVSNTLRMGSVA